MGKKMWEVKFGRWTTIVVIARNAKDAMKKALWRKRKEPYCRLHDITEIEFMIEED